MLLLPVHGVGRNQPEARPFAGLAAAPVLAAGFGAILLSEVLGNLEVTAWLSSCLLLVITGGAVVCSLLFE